MSHGQLRHIGDYPSPSQCRSLNTTGNLFAVERAGTSPQKATDGRFLEDAKASLHEESDAEMDSAIGDTVAMSHYLDLFHRHVAIHCQIPLSPIPFFDFLHRRHTMNIPSQILLHAMLALGTYFSTKASHHADGRVYSKLEHRAIMERARTESNPQSEIDHARLILVLYYSKAGQETTAWSLAISDLPQIFSMDREQRKAQYLEVTGR